MKHSLPLNPSTARALLADKFVESLEAEALNEIQQLWTVEARRRRDEIRSGKVQAVPGEQVLNDVRSLVGR
jgi:Putative addiction module component